MMPSFWGARWSWSDDAGSAVSMFAGGGAWAGVRGRERGCGVNSFATTRPNVPSRGGEARNGCCSKACISTRGGAHNCDKAETTFQIRRYIYERRAICKYLAARWLATTRRALL